MQAACARPKKTPTRLQYGLMSSTRMPSVAIERDCAGPCRPRCSRRPARRQHGGLPRFPTVALKPSRLLHAVRSSSSSLRWIPSSCARNRRVARPADAVIAARAAGQRHAVNECPWGCRSARRRPDHRHPNGVVPAIQSQHVIDRSIARSGRRSPRASMIAEPRCPRGYTYRRYQAVIIDL